MSAEKKCTVAPRGALAAHYIRLDAYLAGKYPARSRSYFQKIIEAGLVEVDGRAAAKNTRLTGCETIRWTEPLENKSSVGQNIPLDVIHEDDDIIVVNKPAGLVVHPACGHPDGTLLNALIWRAAGKWKPYLVHRLDKDTTGVMVAAKNERAKSKLVKQFKARSIKKTYAAVVNGAVDFREAVIDAPLGRSDKNRFIAAVGAGAMKESRTEVETLAAGKDYTALAVKPLTGRTHQIRAHFAYIGHPILGDAVYGDSSRLAPRTLLHARRIEFSHPSSGRRVVYEAPLPGDMKKYFEAEK